MSSAARSIFGLILEDDPMSREFIKLWLGQSVSLE